MALLLGAGQANIGVGISLLGNETHVHLRIEKMMLHWRDLKQEQMAKWQ